jgi:hypothetical protein
VATETSSFNSALVFVSSPSILDVVAVVPRVRNVIGSGTVTFDIKLYQPNDTYCLTTWHVASAISGIEVSWLVVESGVYNVSNHHFMIGSGDIYRFDSSTSTLNMVRFDYPTGCVSSTTSCRFDSTSTVGLIHQIQTLVYDRFLTVRAYSVKAAFMRVLLVPHDSSNGDYYIMTDPERLAYMSFEVGVQISCLESLSFETAVYTSVTSSKMDVSYARSYSSVASVYGMIGTVTSAAEMTSLRVFNLQSNGLSVILQEDQCMKEDLTHATGETVYVLVFGRYAATGASNVCMIKTSS